MAGAKTVDILNEGVAPSASAISDLIPSAYRELRRLAAERMARRVNGQSLTPTELVNEALLRLLKQEGRTYNDVDHLISVASLAMHNVMVDRARRRAAAKRGGVGAKRVALGDDSLSVEPADDMVFFHEACESLRRRSEDHFELVLLRVYAGLTNQEIAARRNQSVRTVERQWKLVKALLHEHLSIDDRADLSLRLSEPG